MMLRSILFICFLYSLFSCKKEDGEIDRRPNVIIIYTDDQGTIDVNSFGAKDLHTPNMDQLAANGVKFTQFYAAAAVCSPSRAALLTGFTPYKAGMKGNASSSKGSEGGLPPEAVTIAERLKENGYATAQIGKWHLGYTTETMPNSQGFDYSFGHMGGCIDNYSHFFYWYGPNRHDLWENGEEIYRDGEYFQDMIHEKAVEFIDEHNQDPFFMYYAINLPHYPLQGTNKWREHYKDLEHPRDKYAAAVSTVDENIGRLVSHLEQKGLKDNTIIIFQSDHGHSMEERTFGGGGSASKFRGSKFSLFEGGIRVPAIISWPQGIEKGKTIEEMAFNVDWFPTILDYCGIEFQSEDFEGKSLIPLIEDDSKTQHDLFCWTSGNDSWAIRKGDWKLLKNPSDPTNKAPLTDKDKVYLVNMKTDPEELVNLASEHPEKVKELTADFEKWYCRER